MTRNWAEIGLTWNTETVSEGKGLNKRPLGTGPIAIVTDLEKFRAHFGDEVVKGSLDGTSIRVMSQGKVRAGIRAKQTDDQIKEATYLTLRGIRSRTGGTTVVVEKVRDLPNGQPYTGKDQTEYQQLYADALIAAGVPTPIALDLAKQQTL